MLGEKQVGLYGGDVRKTCVGTYPNCSPQPLSCQIIMEKTCHLEGKSMHDESPRLRLNPESSALLIIDVQKALFSRPTQIYKADELIRNINSLVERFHLSNALVVYIQHSNNRMLIKGSDGWQFHPDLCIKKIDPIIHKIHGNAFKETNLKQALESRGIEEIVITGLVTHGCVKATSIGGKNLGYRVILVKDGHSNYSKEAPKIIKKWNLKLGEEQVELFSADEISFI